MGKIGSTAKPNPRAATSRGPGARSSRRGARLQMAGALLVLGVSALVLRAGLREPSSLGPVDRAVLTVATPLTRAATWAVEGTGKAWSRYVWLVDVQEENDELRQVNQSLQGELASARRRAEGADRLAALVGLREETGADTTGAHVIAASLGPDFRVSRVVLEQEHELVSGMAVLVPDGLVGRIHRVSGRYADVLLAVDPDSSVDVYLPRSGGRGVLKGIKGHNRYVARIDYLERTEPVEPGDLVSTSGLGGVFPRDVPVGRIVRVSRPEYGLYQEVEVEPAVDFRNLTRVLVVLAPPPPPDPLSAAGDGPREARTAFGVGAYR